MSDKLLTPMLCPHCGWSGTREEADIKLSRDEDEDGWPIRDRVKWQCPACEMIVHSIDEEELL